MSLRTIVRNHRVSLIVIIGGMIYVLTDPFMNYEVLDQLLEALSSFERLKSHEIIFLGMFLLLSIVLDQARRAARYRNQRKSTRDRLAVVQLTMATVQDIVNNALNNLVFIHIEAEKSGALSPESLEIFENLITDTAEKLKDIKALEVISERSLGKNIGSLDMR